MPSPSTDAYADYLRDLGQLVKEYSYGAKDRWLNARGTSEEQFASGYLMGFHRFVTLMQQQAQGFRIPLEHLCLDDIQEEFFTNEERRKV
jgi:hypothetical protein